MAYVYRHVRLDTDEVFYIGIGSDAIGKYKRAHETHHRNSFWKNITNKTDYDIEILLDDLTWEQVCEKEEEFIKLYGRRNLNNGSLVNLTNGGNGTSNRIISLETRKKQSEIAKVRHASGLGHSKESLTKQSLTVKKGYNEGRIAYMTGKKHSEEVLEKIRFANAGKTRTEEFKKNLSVSRLKLSNEQVDKINLLFLDKTLSLTKIAKMFNVAQSTISKIKNKKYYKFN